ncbi:MAG: amino acid permease [Acidobacteriota bacterium]
MQQNNSLTAEGQDDRLLKILGVSFGIAVTIGGMIGLGILRTPGTIAAQLGSPWLILVFWLLGGAYALIATIQVIELATSIPLCGGFYVYARRALGEYPGFLVGWMDWIGYPASYALVGITIGEYTVRAFPQLAGNAKPIAIFTILLLGLLNSFGLRTGCRLQEVISFLKAAIFLAVIAACFIFGGFRSDSAIAEPGAPLGFTGAIVAAVLALQGIIYAYDGWYAAIYFSEENKDPSHSLPRAMITGVLGVTGIYLLFNAALLYVLPLGQIAASELPAADAATAVIGPSGEAVVTSIALVSLLSILNSNMLSGPRILFAMARDGALSRKAAVVNEGGTPVVALAVTAACSLPLVIIGTFETLLAVSAFLFIVIYGISFLSVIVMRRKEPDLTRPFKAWGYPWSTLIVLLGSTAFLIAAVMNDTENSLYAIVAILLSYPAFLVLKRLDRSSGLA